MRVLLRFMLGICNVHAPLCAFVFLIMQFATFIYMRRGSKTDSPVQSGSFHVGHSGGGY